MSDMRGFGASSYGVETYGEGVHGGSITFPTIYVDIAFTSNPGDSTQAWQDITTTASGGRRVRGLTIHRGKQHELDRMQAGTASLVLDNRDRYLDPVYTAGPWYPNILPDRRLRIWVNFDGIEYQLYQGLIDGFPQSYRYPHDGFVQVPVTDAFKMFANFQMKSVYEMEVLADSPAGWWRLGESPPSSGSPETLISVASDSSGNRRDGTYSNDEFPAFSTVPKFGENGAIVGDSNTGVGLAASFDDSGFALHAQVFFDRQYGVSGTADFSVECWFKDDPGVIFAQYGPANGVGWELRNSPDITDNGDGTSTLTRTTEFTVTDTVAVSLTATWTHNSIVQTADLVDGFRGRWHHAMGVRSGTTVYLYVDGVQVATATGSNPSVPVNTFSITSATAFLNSDLQTDDAVVDELALYSSALSAARVLAHYKAGTDPWKNDTTGTRIGRVLDYVGWPAGDREIDAGNTTLQSAFPSGSALDYLLRLMDTEYGDIWLGPDGQVKFRERHALLQETTYSTSQATFGDGPGELPYRDITPTFDDTQIRNDIHISRNGGTEQLAKDATSQGRYFPRTLERTDLEMASDLDAWDQANWILQHYKEPSLRVERIVVEPQRDPINLFPIVFALEIGNRITVKRRPQGVGSAISQDVLIEGITHTLDTSSKHWHVEYQCSPVDTQQYALVGSAVVGTSMAGY